MQFWGFIASDIGAQYIYLALSLVHIWIACDRHFEYWFKQRGVQVEPPLRGLAVANWMYAAVFFMSVLSLGSNPLILRPVVIPYIRLSWFVLGLQLLIVAAIKTFRLLVAWWKIWEGKANARRLVVRGGRVLRFIPSLVYGYRRGAVPADAASPEQPTGSG